MLNYVDLPSSGAPLLVLHGLLGNQANWKPYDSVFQALGLRVIRVDLRNHGGSFHEPEHTYLAMAKDIEALVDHLQIETFHILGHSMGGKVAMKVAELMRDRVESLVSVDIAPVTYREENHYLVAASKIMLANHDSRRSVDEVLSAYISEAGIRQFILTNLRSSSEGLFWRCNMNALASSMKELLSWEPLGIPYYGQSLFISGVESSYVLPEHRASIKDQFTAARFIRIKGAGHWVHVDQVNSFAQTLNAFYRSQLS